MCNDTNEANLNGKNGPKAPDSATRRLIVKHHAHRLGRAG
jgi:hypothetical protein